MPPWNEADELITVSTAVREMEAEAARYAAANGSAPDPIPATAPPLENEAYLAATRRLEGLVAERLALELRLERAVERSRRHGPAPAVVASRAAALFAGQPTDYEPIPHVPQLAEDLEVLKAAESLARTRRDSLRKAICLQITAETREAYEAKTRAVYAALVRLVELGEEIDAWERDMARRDAHDLHHRQRPQIMGVPVDRRTLCAFHDALMLTAPDVLAGTVYQDRPNAPTPNDD